MKNVVVGFDDKKTWNCLNSQPLGVFQVEGSGYTQLLQKIRISDFNTLIDSNALIRPGTSDSQGLQDYVDRATGKKKIEFEHPLLEPILKDTRGIILFQESCLKIPHELAGYTLAEADLFRKAISSKKADMLEKERTKFIDGCAKHNNITKETATSIFNQIVTFAGYAFNKSHSVCYSLISYWTAYLKANYPLEYMSSLLGCQSSEDNIRKYIRASKDLNISIGPPDINESDSSFSIAVSQENTIVFGLSKIKGIGDDVARMVIENRPYNGFLDFLCKLIRVKGDQRAIDSRCIEIFVKAGCFKKIEKNFTSKQLIENIDSLLPLIKSNKFISPQAVARRNLDVWKRQQIARNKPLEYSQLELARLERETVGFFISTHPMRHLKDPDTLHNESYVRLGDMENAKKQFYTVGALADKIRNKKSRRGTIFYELEIEDENNLMKIPVFNSDQQNVLAELIPGDVIAIKMRKNKGRCYTEKIKKLETD